MLISALTAFALAKLCGLALAFDSRAKTPPGLYRGMLHGALMPMAWPSLLLGSDQEIYVAKNEGQLYKLGYSWGVNLSGLIFFGWFFFTVSGFRKRKSSNKEDRNRLDKPSPPPR